jgi:hypothetical protein
MTAFGGLWDPSAPGTNPAGVELFTIFGYTPTQLGSDIIVTATSAPDPGSPFAEIVGIVLNVGTSTLEFYDTGGTAPSKPISYHGWITP